MAVLAFIKMAWEEVFMELYLIGKILFFPLLVVFAALCIPLVVFELVIIDVWVAIMIACSKSLTFSDVFDFFFG